MKKRIITLTLSLLAVVMLVGVGFASWVISQGAGAEGQGNILVETVHDKRLQVAVTNPTDSIQFGSPVAASTPQASDWLFDQEVESGDVIHESLSVEFVVTVTRPTNFGVGETVSITPEFADYILNSNSEHVAWPTELFNVDEITCSEITYNGNQATATVTATLKWGSLFGGDNPYVFFNAHLVSDALGDLAATANTALGLSGEGALAATSTYGDLAFAALNKVLDYNNYKFVITVEVE